MNIVRWIEEANGNWVWTNGEDRLLEVCGTEGKWRTRWINAHSQVIMPTAVFDCAKHARLAAERSFPSEAWSEEWFESMRGGYIRTFDGKNVYVRQAHLGWYAVGVDGKVLGKHGNTAWFTAAADACNAVQHEWYAPKDLDPFAAIDDGWRWIKISKEDRAREA